MAHYPKNDTGLNFSNPAGQTLGHGNLSLAKLGCDSSLNLSSSLFFLRAMIAQIISMITNWGTRGRDVVIRQVFMGITLSDEATSPGSGGASVRRGKST
jgi:hypothetical protein